jgi:cell division protein FtsB
MIQSGIILAVLSATGVTIKAYAELESLKTRVGILEKAIDKLDAKLDELPLCAR